MALNTKKSLYSELKRLDEKKSQNAKETAADAPLALDDTQRVKVLSPSRLVAKRFFRNKLAMVGLAILITMFVFAFIGPLPYPYSQTQIFYKYDKATVNYASATQRVEYVSYKIPGGAEIASNTANYMNSYIKELESEGVSEKSFMANDGISYTLNKLGDRVYTLSAPDVKPVARYYGAMLIAVYDKILDSFTSPSGDIDEKLAEAAKTAALASESGFSFNGTDYAIVSPIKNKYEISRADTYIEYVGSNLGESFNAAIEENIENDSFSFNGVTYAISKNEDESLTIGEAGELVPSLVASTYVFNVLDVNVNFSDEFKADALLAIYGGGDFAENGASYKMAVDGGDVSILDGNGVEVALLSPFAVRRYSGQDTLPLAFKDIATDTISQMIEENAQTGDFVYKLPDMDTEGNPILDESGVMAEKDTVLHIIHKATGEYVLTCEQTTYLIDLYGARSRAHIAGTDGDGMDLMARMMYGGRVSLLVGFVVVLLEVFLGVVMGGVAGYFGGWVDMLIMRLADVFFCIPTLPILIITGAFFDNLKMDPYERMMWMMAILGFLGWAFVARLVRGQIMSLREQEFMIAQESTGMKASRRIFRHLLPNVMPQLIVYATMGLGEVILLESTLSFLGLGVKRPLATWGSMIYSVTSSSENMIRYAYIWVPLGMLICLTVVAFNFVGDGLRDAFDPKMKQ